jgi:magnesium-protoporphyrin O-methyltransferase
MTCCCIDATGKFFDKHARRTEKYFRKKGLRPEQKFLAEGIRQNGLRDTTILEIGCGVGALHLSLLKEGAAKAIGFDISEEMIASARKLSAEMGFAGRTSYTHGDFVTMHEGAPEADVTILDKVICCYENVEELIAHSTAKTRRLYAVSYPRKSRVVRIASRFIIAMTKLFRQAFHPYYHEPDHAQQLVGDNGFEKIYEQHTLIWAVQVFKRKNGEVNS